MRRAWPLLVLVLGCVAETERPAWLLDEPRVLAILATPPALLPTGSTELAALVVEGERATELTDASWRACPPWVVLRDPDRDCPASLAMPLAVEAGTARLSVPALASHFGIAPPPVEPTDDPCEAPAAVDVAVVFEGWSDGQRLIAVKQVAVGALERRNPELGPLLVDGQAGATGYRPGQAHTLSVDVAFDSLDLRCNRDGELVPERVRVYLYATAGDIDDARLSIDHEVDGTVDAETATWRAPEAGPVTLWLVAVEGDGGVAWRSLALDPTD